MSGKFRFGLIGCGAIGPLHAKAISCLPDAEIVGVTDIIAEKAQKLAIAYEARAYTDIDEMLNNERLDIVIVCTPSGMHGQHACQVMRAGHHVIVEKPMEICLEAIDEMLRVQRETGVKLAVMSQRRFDPAVHQVRALLQENALGKLLLGNAVIPWWRSQDYYDNGKWRGTWKLDGGGVLMNQSIHYIDLLQWMMGPVQSIKAYTNTLAHNMETEDVAVAILYFVSGALGTITATTGAYPGLTGRLELFGNGGSAIIEGDELTYLHLARDEQRRTRTNGSSSKTSIDRKPSHRIASASNALTLVTGSHASQIADMLRAIREDGTPLMDGYAARLPVEIILGIYESARTRAEVVLHEPSGTH